MTSKDTDHKWMSLTKTQAVTFNSKTFLKYLDLNIILYTAKPVQ